MVVEGVPPQPPSSGKRPIPRTQPNVTDHDHNRGDRLAAEVLDYATDPTRFSQWQKGVIDGHLCQGVALTDVSQVLRHRDLATTAIYTKIDLVSLRAVARHWPGAHR